MKRTVKDLVDLKGKVVILRVDFNVPTDNVGRILDLNRVMQALPTIRYLVKHEARVVILSHMGRPKGYDIRKSLWPISLVLMKKLNTKVYFCNKAVGEEVKERVRNLANGTVLMLENVRFYHEETECDMKFAREIASYGDIYVNDAFGVSHRKHASTYGVARILPNAIGLLMEKEIGVLSQAMESPKHPFVAIIGGAKVPDKIKILKRFVDVADIILIGGAMAYTFMVARGESIGSSLIYMDQVKTAKEILNYAEAQGKKILLPIDHVVARKKDKRERSIVVSQMVDDMVGYDIGPKTIKMYGKVIMSAGQIIWNGPLGMYEKERYRKGTYKIAKWMSKTKAYTIIGGGDSVGAVKNCGVARKIDFLSTGGGATLKFIEDGNIVCLEVIQEKIK